MTHRTLRTCGFSLALSLSVLSLACSSSTDGDGGDGDGDGDGDSNELGGAAGDGDIAGDGDGDATTGALPGDLGSVGGVESGGDVAGLQYYGRWDFSDEANPVASWGNVFLTARFSGTRVGIRLNDSNNDFQYRVDNGEMKVLSPTAATEYTLAEGLADGEHTLEFYRRSGGSFGRTTVSGLILDEGAALLPAPGRPMRKIEVMGDSISVGYGNETDTVSNPPQAAGTGRDRENGYEAYGPQLARMLDAQWSIIAHSGQGMVRNLGADKTVVEDQMPEEFMRTFFPGGGAENPDWDFTRYQPDVLIVTLGTNDFSWPQWDMDPGAAYELTEEEFVGGYSEFLTFARSVYPDAEIFAVGTFISNSTNQFGRANDYICTAITQMADENMHCIDPGGTGPDGIWLGSGTDYIGDWTHPTVAGHTKIAEKLHAIIAPEMGW